MQRPSAGDINALSECTDIRITQRNAMTSLNLPRSSDHPIKSSFAGCVNLGPSLYLLCSACEPPDCAAMLPAGHCMQPTRPIAAPLQAARHIPARLSRPAGVDVGSVPSKQRRGVVGRWDTYDCHVSTCCSCSQCCLLPSMCLSADSARLDVMHKTLCGRLQSNPMCS